MELFLESFPKIFISGIIMTLPLALVSFIFCDDNSYCMCHDPICESTSFKICCSILYMDI